MNDARLWVSESMALWEQGRAFRWVMVAEGERQILGCVEVEVPTLLPRSKKCPSSNTLQYILESMLARVGGVEVHAVDARQRPRPEVDQVQRVADHARSYLLKSGYNIPSTTCSTVPS